MKRRRDGLGPEILVLHFALESRHSYRHRGRVGSVTQECAVAGVVQTAGTRHRG